MADTGSGLRPGRRRIVVAAGLTLGVVVAVALWLGLSGSPAPRPRPPREATLVLALVGPDGHPVGGAQVACTSAAGGAVQALSDAGGQARCPSLPVGSVTATVSRSGFARRRARFVLAPGERRERVQLEAAAPVEGSVVDDRGEPVAGAALSLARVGAAADAEPWRLTSGPDGRFRFDTTPAGFYELDASAGGHERAAIPRLRAPTREPLLVQLDRSASITAHVVSPEGAAAAGASVIVAGSGIWPPRRLETDAGGLARFEGLPAGVYELRASTTTAASPPTEGQVLELGGSLELTLRLEPAVSLRGLVTDAQSGEPLAGAEVLVAEDALSAAPHPTTSGADGTFAVDGLRPVEHRVSVRAAGYVAVTGQSRLADGSVHAFALDRAASVAGRVVDEAGEPVAGAELEVAGSTQAGAPVALSPAAVRFQAALFASQQQGALPLSTGDTLGVTHGPVPKIPLTPATSGEGQAAAAAWGAAGGFRSGEDGSFQIAGIPAGSLRLLARQAGFAAAKSERIDLTPGQALTDVVLTLRTGGSVVGRVVDARGFPVESVRVELESPDEPLPRVALSDDGGGFRFDGIRGPCGLTAHALGHAPVHAETRVEAEQEAAVTLTLGGEARTLEGRIFDPSGFPVEGAAIRVTARAGHGLQRSALSAADGTFRVGGLPAPPYAVRVDHPDFAPTDVPDVTDTTRPLKVHLEPGLRFAGQVLDDHADEPLSGARVILRGEALVLPRQASTDSHGRFELGNLPAGNYEVTVLHRGFVTMRRERAIDASGSAADAVGEFRLTPAGGAAGTVVDRLGRPAAGARVAVGSPADWSRAVTANAKGEFEMPELPPGEHSLSARHPSAGEALEAVEVRVYPLQRSPGVLLRLPEIADEQPGPAPPDRAAATAEPAGAPAGEKPAATASGGETPIELRNDGNAVVVAAVAPGSPAARAGVRAGDHLRAVDGEPVLTASQGRGMLRGTQGSPMTLELARGKTIHRVRLRR